MTVLPGCLACPGKPPWSRPAADGACRRRKPALLHPPGEFGELAAVRLDDEVHRAATGRPDLRRQGHRDEHSAGPHHGGRTVKYLPADRVQHDIHLPSHLLEALAVKVGELLRAARRRGGAVPSPPGARDAGAGLPGQLDRQVASCSLARAPARSALVAGRRGRTAPARPLARLATARQH